MVEYFNNIAVLCKNLNQMKILFDLLQDNNIKHTFNEQYQTFDSIYEDLFIKTTHYISTEPIFFMVGKINKSEYWYWFRMEKDYRFYNDWKDWKIVNANVLFRKLKLKRILNEKS